MPRNGSDGTFALADIVAPATLADANQMMTILNDIASSFTGSIAKDGQTPITGQLKGLVSSNPVYSFNGDLNTGFGSDTADEIYMMAGGTRIAKVSSAGLNVLSGALLVASSAVLPVGIIVEGTSQFAPTGWVMAHGGSIGDASSGATIRANADCQNLFAEIYNGSNNASGMGQIQDSAGTNTSRGASAAADFAAHKRILLPDYSDRTSRGKAGGGSVGQTLGADTTSVLQANLPAVNFVNSGIAVADSGHGHGVSDPGHSHTLNNANNLVIPGGGSFFGGGASGATVAVSANAATTGITVNTGVAFVSITQQGAAFSGGSGVALDVKPKAIQMFRYMKL